MTDAGASPEPIVRWDEFIRLDEDDLRELIDGRLVELEVPDYEHGRIVGLLVYYLQAWVLPRDAGVVLSSGYKIRISDLRGVMPDVQYLSHETAAKAGQLGMQEGRPDLAVEVISPTSRRYDRVTKLAWYASIGVPEYWLVDRDARIIERLVLTPEGYVIAQTAAEGDFQPASFEGLSIPLTALFPEEGSEGQPD
ncbi:MAG: Uma2 family endonuclease [Myxococcota bacterium]